MKPFEYNHTLKLTPELFIQLRSVFPQKNRSLRRLAILAGGISCLFWSYTILLGVALLALLALAMFMPRILPAGAALTYRDSPHLHQSLTFSVSDVGMQVQSKTLNLQCTWLNLKVWIIRDEWLILSPTGMQELFFKVEDLKNAGVFDDVILLARQHGVEYDSPESKMKPKVEPPLTPNMGKRKKG